jgi:large subunit ribosomal protein L6
MSRIGKKPIEIPAGVEVKIEGQKVTIKGSQGELSREIRPEIKVEVKEKNIFVSPKKEISQEETSGLDKKIKAFWGLSRALLANMIKGVTAGFEKKLEIQGVGFRAEIEGESLVLYVGFAHSVKLKIPQELKVSIDKNIISISGIDKGAVGQFAATVRKVKPPEPYKGKGIRYVGETVRRKVGKKVVAAAT